MSAPAWPKNATTLAAPHVLSEFGACVGCGQPVHTTGTGSAVHTATGLYACTVGYTGTAHGAELDTSAADRDVDDEIAEAVSIAESEAAETARENVGYDLGRKLQDLESRYLGDDDVPGQVELKAVLDAMHAWLADL